MEFRAFACRARSPLNEEGCKQFAEGETRIFERYMAVGDCVSSRTKERADTESVFNFRQSVLSTLESDSPQSAYKM